MAKSGKVVKNKINKYLTNDCISKIKIPDKQA